MSRRIALVLLTLLCGAACSMAQDDAPIQEQGIVETVHQNEINLWRARITALSDKSLQALADKTQSLQRATTQASASTTRPASAPAVAASQPASQPVTAAIAATAPTTTSAPAMNSLVLTPAVAAALRKCGTSNPLAVGDELFVNGHLQAAGIFYEQAIQNPQFKNDMDWLVFQLANCKSIDEPAAAVKLYGQLLNEYPKSPWCSLANSRMQLLAWKETLKVQPANTPSRKGAAK